MMFYKYINISKFNYNKPFTFSAKGLLFVLCETKATTC